MLQKNTTYQLQLRTLPRKLQTLIKQRVAPDVRYEIAHLIIMDMLFILKMWRHIKGYPANGQATHTNSNTSKKNKVLLNFRLDQFYAMFGKKTRNIFPILIQAEYNNRLWYHI